MQRAVVIPYRPFRTTCRYHLQRSRSPHEDGTTWLSRNVGTELCAAPYPRREQISPTWRRKPEITYRILLLLRWLHWQIATVNNPLNKC